MSDKIDSFERTSWVYCNRCKGDTRHNLLSDHKRQEGDDFDKDGVPNIIYTWITLIWKCAGCDSITLEVRFQDNFTYGNDGPFWESEFYPKRNRSEISKKHFSQLPKKLDRIYAECLTALNSGSLALCTAGLRALIEGICNEMKIKGRDLKAKIDGLEPILPGNIVRNLHAFRFMGNEALHDLLIPSDHEIRLAVEVCEDLMNFLYELDYKTARLGRNRVNGSKLISSTSSESNSEPEG